MTRAHPAPAGLGGLGFLDPEDELFQFGISRIKTSETPVSGECGDIQQSVGSPRLLPSSAMQNPRSGARRPLFPGATAS